MARYIDADKALDRLYDICAPYEEGREVKEEAIEIIADFPAADVQEVKHGKWIKRYFGGSPLWDESIFCSVCDKTGSGIASFCSKCGAKMDLEEIENIKGKTK